MRLREAALVVGATLILSVPAGAQTVDLSMKFNDIERVNAVGTQADAQGAQGRWFILAGNGQLTHFSNWDPEPGASPPFTISQLNAGMANADVSKLSMLREVFEECTRFALLVQNQPTQYDLILHVRMTGGQPTWSSSSLTTAVWLEAGDRFWCQLARH